MVNINLASKIFYIRYLYKIGIQFLRFVNEEYPNIAKNSGTKITSAHVKAFFKPGFILEACVVLSTYEVYFMRDLLGSIITDIKTRHPEFFNELHEIYKTYINNTFKMYWSSLTLPDVDYPIGWHNEHNEGYNEAIDNFNAGCYICGKDLCPIRVTRFALLLKPFLAICIFDYLNTKKDDA
jgi:hypothetical protein